jgi:hypothetical protein
MMPVAIISESRNSNKISKGSYLKLQPEIKVVT